MDRRVFLRGLAATGVATFLAGCATRDGGAGDRTTTGERRDAAALVADASQSLTLITATFEQLVGAEQPFAFGLTTEDNEPVKGADVQVYVVSPDGEEAGPFTTDYRDVEGIPLGLYMASLDFPEAGQTTIVAVTADGKAAGSTTVNVTTPENSEVAAPGQEAVVVATPTFAEPLGFENVCTLDPPCGMHEISFDDALAAGRPVMLTFATPGFCMTAVCGPSVEVVDEVRQSRDWGDTAWIHVEIYEDAGETLSDPVKQWELPSEPWLFAVKPDETLAARADGPLLVIPEHVASVAEQLQ